MFFSPKYGNIGTFGIVFYEILVIIIPLLQAYVLCLFPIGLYLNYYNWPLVLLIIGIAALLKFLETLSLVFINKVLLKKNIDKKSFFYDGFFSFFHYFAILFLLNISEVFGIVKFLLKVKTWKRVPRKKPKNQTST